MAGEFLLLPDGEALAGSSAWSALLAELSTLGFFFL
jgi:hypothetical protein